MIHMRSQSGTIGRTLTDEKSDSKYIEKTMQEETMYDVVQKVSLENVSLEERRKEAKEPLYLARYE
jgi:hypothetical protein